jgi:hypothetical protein
MSAPLISICLPNLNTRPFLPQRMDTIFAQTLRDWELIVCDSHSEDGSWEFFQKFAGDKRVRLHQVPRAGVYAGWNECLRRANGQYIYIATSDDTAEPTLLETLVGALERFPDVKMASCNFTPIDEAGRPIPRSQWQTRGLGINGEEIYAEWLQKNHRRHGPSEFVATCVANHVWTTITAIVFRRRLLEQTGLFAEKKAPVNDVEWALRACLCTDTIHVAQPLATLRIHGSQASQRADSTETAALQLRMLQRTVRQFESRLPAALRTPAAERKLLWPKRAQAYNALQLHGRNIVRHPVEFVRMLGKYPGLAARHALHGFRWSRRPTVDAKAYTEQLLREFGLPPICEPVALH